MLIYFKFITLKKKSEMFFISDMFLISISVKTGWGHKTIIFIIRWAMLPVTHFPLYFYNITCLPPSRFSFFWKDIYSCFSLFHRNEMMTSTSHIKLINRENLPHQELGSKHQLWQSWKIFTKKSKTCFNYIASEYPATCQFPAFVKKMN